MKISVVTVCYNAVDSIEKTINSVINQTYQDVEYVIVDGKSTDGTVDIIKKYSDRVSKWISERDNGIYDAMNKAIDFVSGDYVLFMNSGDYFYSDTVVDSMVRNFSCTTSAVIYGDTKYIKTWGQFELIPDKLDAFRTICPFCHQSAFIKTELMKKYKYNTIYKFAADYDFFHRLWVEGEEMIYFPITISVFDGSGQSFSGKHPFKVNMEEMKIANNGSCSLFTLLRFLPVLIKTMIAWVIRKLPLSRIFREKRFKNNTRIKTYQLN